MKKFVSLLLATLMLLGLLTACNLDAEKIDWVNIKLGYVLPEPQSNLMKIISNGDDNLMVYIHKISQNQYLEYQRWCEQENGFNIEPKTLGNSFYAYNKDGYYLSLYYNDNQDQLHISLNAPIPMEEFALPSYAIDSGLPIPKSKVGHFNWQNEKGFYLYVGETTKDNYMFYKDACVAAGFTVDLSEYDTVYSAKNAEGYKVSLNYKGFNIFTIEFKIPDNGNGEETHATENKENNYTLDYSDAVSFEAALNNGENVKGAVVQFNVVEYKPDSVLGINCWSGEHLNFISEKELDVEKGNVIIGRITAEPTKSLGSWTIPYEVISISEEKVDEEITESSNLDELSNVQPTEIIMINGEDDFKGMNYKEAENVFCEMGFTKFKYETIDTEVESDNDTICYIEITEWIFGDSDFVKGDKFDSDSTVTFYTYKYKAPSPVFYSTNDYKTATKGNTGVFSYKNKNGSYDVYWIIDFDAGYIYNFTEGNGESSCDRVKIVSGDLNDRITATWHDGGDQWSWYLHFKYVNSPVTLIVNDHFGLSYEFSATNLYAALALRDTKTIKDY